MRIGVLHNTLNSVGGGERLCLKTIEALKDAGHEVILGTVEPTDWARVRRLLGETIRPDVEISLLCFKLGLFGIYLRLLTAFLASRVRKQSGLLINTHGDVLPVRADIIYMHYPTFALLRETPVNIKYVKSPLWRAYFLPYAAIQSWLVDRRPFLTGMVLTNSKFSQRAIKKYIGKSAQVLYPPVDVEKFRRVAASQGRESLVVSCGRYSPEKNYELVLEVAAELGDKARFVIVGASSGRVSSQYYEKLARMKRRIGLSNVELLSNIPFANLLDIYARAKIYLHAMKYEHFGIAVVEAMSAGLVPVVHRSGGPWEDILGGKQDVHGYSFLTAHEASQIIAGLLHDDVSEEIRERNAEYVSCFSSAAFEEKLLRVISSCREDLGRS